MTKRANAYCLIVDCKNYVSLVKKFLLVILALVLLISCESKVNYEKPTDLIPKDSMIELLYDMHLGVGTSNLKNKNKEKDRNYMSLIYEKYGIDSVRFANSNVYYTSQAVEYEEMFEVVEKRLETLHEKYENERDSAISASKKRPPKPIDSLRRVEEIEH